MQKKDWWILLLPVLLLVALVPFLPDRIPMQWNLRGEVIWTMHRYLLPLVGLLPFVVHKSRSSRRNT